MRASLEVLRTTLEHAIERTPESGESQLLEAVHAFVDAHKRGGVLPERLVIEVKELARSAVRKRALSRSEPPGDDEFSQVLVERVIRWAIERYYSGNG